MWMMGYNDGAELNLHDSFNATSRRLRPLIPRPNLPHPNPNNNTPSPNPPCFFAQYHPLAGLGEQNKRELMNTGGTTPQVVVSSRWNPTPEQLRALEELYRRGTRTPSAEQIQHITAQLRRYGKIEGKNVFYWFQNHKARERQKRRRQMESSAPSPADDLESERPRDIGANRTVFEVEQTKHWPLSSNCSTTTLSEESIQRTAANNNNNSSSNKGTGSLQASECVRTDGWTPLAQGELQSRRNNMSFVERNATWQMMQFTHLINTSASITKRASLLSSTCMDQRLVKTFASSNAATSPFDHDTTNSHVNSCVGSPNEEQAYSTICSSSSEESQTLELFPLRSCSEVLLAEKETNGLSVSAMSTPSQFFEFLPLKN